MTSHETSQTVEVTLNPESIGDLDAFEERRKAALASRGSEEPISFEQVLSQTQYGGISGETETDSSGNLVNSAYEFVTNRWMAQELDEQDEILESATKRVDKALGKNAAKAAFEYVVKIAADGSVKGIFKHTELRPTQAWDTWNSVKAGTMPANTPHWRGQHPHAKSYSEPTTPKE